MNSEEKRVGRGRGRGLNKGWLGNFKPKPVPITVEQILESQFADSDQKTVGTITTRLSEQTLNSNSVVPDEKPPNKVEQENNKHLNSVLLKAVNVKEFIPTASFKPISNQSVIQDSIPADEAPPTNAFLVGDTGDEYAQSVLMNVVLTLTMYPGEFDNQIVWVADELRKHVKTEDSLKEVIRIILEQAIAETNFSYGAAKMCHYFDEKKVFEELKVFRKIFFKMCQDKFNLVKNNLSSATSPTDLKTLSNIAILFGELYCNMKIKDRPIVVYKKALLSMVKLFLESKEELLIRCLTRLLKLVGPEMDNEMDNEKDKDKEVDDMFEKLRDFSFDPSRSGHLPDDVKQGIRRVYKLRTRKWDQDTPPSSPMAMPSPTGMPQFHLPAERKASGSTIDWNDYYVGDDGDIYNNFMGESPDAQQFGMVGFSQEDEEEDAYEEFLRMSGQL